MHRNWLKMNWMRIADKINMSALEKIVIQKLNSN